MKKMVYDMPILVLKEKRRIAKRKWREKNRAKERLCYNAWAKKNPEKRREQHRRDYLKRKKRYIELARKWAAEHGEEVKHYMHDYNFKRHRNFKLQVFSHYSSGKLVCVCCGESILDFLTLDHIEQNGNEHRNRVGSAHIYKDLIKNNFPVGYQVLCMNCNFGRSLKYNRGVCPHKRGENASGH